MRSSSVRVAASILIVGMSPGLVTSPGLWASENRSALPNEEFAVPTGTPLAVKVPAPPDTRLISVLISLKDPSRLSPGASIAARIEPATTATTAGWPLTKTLHMGDADVVWTVRQRKGESFQISISPPSPPEMQDGKRETARIAVRVADLGGLDDGSAARVVPGDTDRVEFEAEPNDTPETANPLTLGQAIYGLADDRSYLPLHDQPTDAELTGGADWFTFRFESATPRLAFFGLDFVDRDVPPDVRVYQKKDGKLVEYTRGIDPQSLQRERPPRPGANKFTTRVLTEGTYYVWVDACQPEYQLRTKLFDVPPYLTVEQVKAAEPETIAAAARKAIRSAMDFQLLAGDSWHANTPRKGHPTDRVANFHHETSTCVACHPTHFTTQSALAAVKAGYGVEQPFALTFLTERLANNPVPFHGHPDALWARMIPAPANVLGRLSTILMDFENRVAGSPRDNLHRGIAEFLKLYYDGRTELPADETNGNNPVSRYKVATDSWRQLDEISRRTGDARYVATRDLVAALIPTGEPAHTRDLAAQTIGLCLLGSNSEMVATKIRSNVAQLRALQRSDGHWSVKFDPAYAITEMQTGESLYALALAGLKPEDPTMRRGIVALLGRQQEFGGWFDVNPYEQFRTPFRETQWALIALSSLYPNRSSISKGWNSPLGSQPSTLRTGSAAMVIRDLERIWDVPGPDLQDGMVAALRHEFPLVRYAACRALARVGDAGPLAELAKCLGDESKVVGRAAAEAIRLIGDRLNAAHRPGETTGQVQFVTALRDALGSPDDRTRRGAARVFAAHFRDLSQEHALADAVLMRLGDPDPVVAMEAIQGLWRWWYWQANTGLRERIEDALIAELAQPRHPWVRRNLIEALYIIGDENIRYLDKNWVPSLANAESRRRATAAQHATVNRLGRKYVAALRNGNKREQEGVLRAMSEFFERPVLGGRIGNDLEPMLFHDDIAREVRQVLIARMGDADPTIRTLALQALVTIRNDRSADLARAVTRKLGDSSDSVRNWALAMSKEFPLEIRRGQPDPETLAMADELLAQPGPAAQVAALRILGRVGTWSGMSARLAIPAMVRSRLSAEYAAVRAAALDALRSFPDLWVESPVREAIKRGLDDADPQVRVAALRLALEPKAKVAESALRKALNDPAPSARIALLEQMASETELRGDLRLIGAVCNAVVDEHGGVREKALQLIQTHPSFVSNAAIEESLRELLRSNSSNLRQREIAEALLATRGKSSAGGVVGDRLDLAYFEARVLPVFNRVGEDGQNCMGCHRSHTVLRMVPPGKDGRWSMDDLRANYRAALRVVDLARPAASLLLGKPTWEAADEAEAQNDPTKKAHAGGVRFEVNSREYQTLLDWINGARLAEGASSVSK